MTTPIKIKRSGTASSTPSSLDHGELAINYADATLFWKDDANVIQSFVFQAYASATHKSSHATGGSDALTPSDIGAAPLASPTFTGTVTVPGLTSTGVILADDSVAANSVVYSFDGDPNTGIGRGGADIVTVVTNGSERVRVDSGGNVGVGTSPASFNSAFNNVVIGNGSTVEGMTIYSSAQGTLAFGDTATTGADGYQGYLAYIHSGDYMVMATGGAERLRVSAVGAGFGVGDLSRFSSSFRDIVVGSGVGNHGITINSGQADVSTLAFASNVAQFRGAVQYFNETWAGGEYMRFLVGTLSRLAILANGRVGVGTEAPSSLLHVAGVITVSATSGSAGSYAPSVTFSGDANTGFGQVSGQSDSASIFTAGHERVRVRSDGNVGIGSAGGGNAGLWLQPTLASTSDRYGLYARITGTAASSSPIYACSTFADLQSSASTSLAVNYQAIRPQLAAGASVTTAVGLLVESSFTVATTNYGVRLSIGGGSGRWNIYADGTAPNHFAGNVGIGSGNTSPTAALDINSDKIRLRTAKTPASASDTGNAGDICWDANYLYICIASGTWRRVAHSTW